MQYYELTDDMSMRMRWRWHVGEVFLPNREVPWLSGGIQLNDPQLLGAEVHHIGEVLEFCHTTFGVPIANPVLAKEIHSIAGSDVQTIPLAISGQVGMVVLNALRVIECVSEVHSKFEKYTKDDPVRPDKAGQYRYFEKLVLAQAAIPPDAHFFRIKGWLIGLVVSETVKDAMESVGCYGAKFIELEMA